MVGPSLVGAGGPKAIGWLIGTGKSGVGAAAGGLGAEELEIE